jgi:hypothetical protein
MQHGNISVLPMPTITVKLDKKRAERLARWARRRKVPKSEVIRTLIDQAGPIETGDDLIEVVRASQGKGLGLAPRKR